MKGDFKELSDCVKDLQRLYIFAEEGNMQSFLQVLDRIPDYILDDVIASEIYTILKLNDNEEVAEGLAYKVALFEANRSDDPSDYMDKVNYFEYVYKLFQSHHRP